MILSVIGRLFKGQIVSVKRQSNTGFFKETSVGFFFAHYVTSKGELKREVNHRTKGI
jgi:hypothetical protein